MSSKSSNPSSSGKKKKKTVFKVCFLVTVVWGGYMTFTKVLTIYCSWIHPPLKYTLKKETATSKLSTVKKKINWQSILKGTLKIILKPYNTYQLKLLINSKCLLRNFQLLTGRQWLTSCKPSYLRSNDQEDHCSKLTRANSFPDPTSKTPNTKKGWWRGSSGRVPEALSLHPSVAKSNFFPTTEWT
jgi:hypothetical protein